MKASTKVEETQLERTPRPLDREARSRAQQLGLYRPDTEKDACGVGFVASSRGECSHRIIALALSVLENLEHRGAQASDPTTGDGAGILLQIPHQLFAEDCERLGFAIGAPNTYGVGMLFLPKEEQARSAILALVERVVTEEGQFLLGVRPVPIQHAVAGVSAREEEPSVVQVFIGPGTLPADDFALDRKLYVVRKRIEREVRARALGRGDYPYFASLSTRTIVYKGLLTPEQLSRYYLELADPRAVTTHAVVHQRFSTNTFPSWTRAHPYRRVAHNGEINTLRGNVAWMAGREPVLVAPVFGEDVQKLVPVIDTSGSDSAQFDDVLELLVHTGRSLPHALMMMIPEAWEKDASMPADKRDFYAYHACLMEPWDGPACIVFSDGRLVGATLDRNGQRPARYATTKDGLVVLASESGVLPLEPAEIVDRGRLRPGRMFVVDTIAGRIVDDAELKSKIASRRPYGRWVGQNLVKLSELSAPPGSHPPPLDAVTLTRWQRAFGYTEEELEKVLLPMAETGEEAIGSMGNDAALACLSDEPQLLYAYFRQLFAQVTNPPIDPLREALVMSLVQRLGPESNLFSESPAHAHKLEVESPVLTEDDLVRIQTLAQAEGDLAVETIHCTVSHARIEAALEGGGLAGEEPEAVLEVVLGEVAARAEAAVRRGASLLVLSDRGVSDETMPVPMLLALGVVHAHLVARGLRQGCGLIVDTCEAREPHHVALLVGFGAGAVHPYLGFETLRAACTSGRLELPYDKAAAHYKKALEKSLLKIMSKMGISTVQSYRGARIFEAIGLSEELVGRYFGGVATHLAGLGLVDVMGEAAARHRAARLPAARTKTVPVELPMLAGTGRFRARERGEKHAWSAASLGLLQHAVRSGDYAKFKAFTRRANDDAEKALVRGLLELVPAETPLSLDEVEPAHEIVRRFRTGAMSFGSISKEAHETLAVAMNRLGAASNTGEGGEDPARWEIDENGDTKRSSIKQIASGRFGVTIEYLAQAEELQIKIAQGAKPGEGGQLPGHKVDALIAKTRHSTAGVGLISPPPHHDIYSIEDLAQLVYDLKNANPSARVSVKLVAEAGVGTVAAGVAKAKADHILVSGDAGGTGASPLTSIKHAGIPWEIGLAETQQVLVLNGLRDRVRLETDGQLKTGRDVVIAALLGAEGLGFGTIALVTMGCVLMRVCHLNTCPVGVATQDPRLRARFRGEPEHVINFFAFLAEEVRELMAMMGFRTFDEMVGRSDRLRKRSSSTGDKAQKLDVSRLLHVPSSAGATTDASAPRHRTSLQDHELELALDTVLLEQARPALERGEDVEIDMPIRNVHRTTCTMLSHEVAERYGSEGLPDATIRIRFEGSAGQSFGAFLAKGLDVTLNGDANDGVGKGLSGGRIVISPPDIPDYVAENNVIVGNVALYGATSGEMFLRGQAGERFAVRNSGATAVVEGVGDHGCEYMTGGRVVVLGTIGRNFAAGMSGGIAYVLEASERVGSVERLLNRDTVAIEPMLAEDLQLVRQLVHRHHQRTMSPLAWRVLSGWKQQSRRFVKVMPTEYKKVVAQRESLAPTGAPPSRVSLHPTSSVLQGRKV
jgi:glutamate synthase domain-containing protein 2/glutamate synthase domain-containing protein 1/glutamate synthase domain-containing protein 3